MILGKINLNKVDEKLLFKGEKGTYLDIVLKPNRDGTDQYGNDGMITQDVTREKREAGIRGPIIGNYKVRVRREDKPAQKKDDHVLYVDEDNIDEIPL